MKTCLVLEGGAMRGMYTAGALDVFYNAGIQFDGIIGVSAGAAFGVNYLSRQPGRVIRYNKRFNADHHYMGLIPLLKTGNIVDTEYAYEKVPRELDPFDGDTFDASGVPFWAVVTNVKTGQPEYIRLEHAMAQMDVIRASASRPFVSQPVKIGGKLYLDGGVADSIPFRAALPTEAEYDAVYRIDTDVITSTTLSTTDEINNDAKATVTFSIGGRSYQMSGVVIPENGSQLVWVKWHTPSEPCEITINISTNKGSLATTTIRANVVDLNENPTPDPMADDRYNGYSRPSLPAGQNVTSLSWGIWRCWWHTNWVWVSDWDWESGSHSSSCPAGCTSGHGHWVDNGEWEDQGWYDYALDTYSASLSAAMRITPDEKNPTASGSTLKSGYGINMTATADMRSGAPASHITQVQTCVAYFPEFHYTDYWRLLEPTSPGYPAQFEFQRNEYSTYNRRTHFTPVWFPDGNYTVYAQVIDAWTPAGMLQMHLNDTLTIHDNLFSDWHVRPLN